MPGHRQTNKRGVKVPRFPAPYGRQPDSAPRIGDPEWDEAPAVWCVVEPYRLRSVPMPRGGGVRWLVSCPRCDRWVRALYAPRGTSLYNCRHCWGLRYRSSYELRRPECDLARIEELSQSARRAFRRSPDAALKRYGRALAAQEAWREHADANYQAEWATVEHLMERVDAKAARNARRRAYAQAQARKGTEHA